MKREEIVEAARGWMGVKWRHMGRNRQGLDCLGLLVVVAQHFGIEHHGDEVNYRRVPDGDRLVNTLTSQLVIRHPPLKTGMVVVMRDHSHACHVGIIGTRLGEQSLIHASLAHRQVYEEPWARWKPTFRMALDYPGIED